jgi:hypothetical protein
MAEAEEEDQAAAAEEELNRAKKALLGPADSPSVPKGAVKGAVPGAVPLSEGVGISEEALASMIVAEVSGSSGCRG